MQSLHDLTKFADTAQASGRSQISQDDCVEEILAVSLRHFDTAYLVVDGLDECQNLTEMVGVLLSLFRRMSNLRVLVLSRDHPQIRSKLGSFPSIELTPRAVKADIDSYVHHTLQQPNFNHIDRLLQSQIGDKICSGAHGCFLWAYLMVNAVEEANSSQELEQLLDAPPRNLAAFYKAVTDELNRKATKKRILAAKALKWICFSIRPLKWAELRTALATDIDDQIFDNSKAPFQDAIVGICSPLIRYQSSDDRFYPLHASVSDHLTRPSPEDPETYGPNALYSSLQDAHALLGRVCMTFLTFHDPSITLDDGNPKASFTQYASIHWAEHILRSSPDPKNTNQVQQYLRSQNADSWISIFLLQEPSSFPLQRLLRLHNCLIDWGRFDRDTEASSLRFRVLKLITSLEKAKPAYQAPSMLIKLPATTSVPCVSYFERLTLVRDLSREFNQNGQIGKAIEWFEQAVEDREKDLGPENPSCIWLLNALGILYDQQNRTDLSALIQEQALSVQIKYHGLEHAESVWTHNELGRIYRHLGRLTQAEACHYTALQVQQRCIPNADRNLEVAWTVSTLGRVYRQQRRFQLALDHFFEALQVRCSRLGDDHPHSLWLLGDIAQTNFEVGNLETALGYHEMALEKRRRVLGPEHPDTLWTMNDLGVVLAAMGRSQSNPSLIVRAQELQLAAFEGQRRLLGEIHPHTTWTREVLGCLASGVISEHLHDRG